MKLRSLFFGTGVLLLLSSACSSPSLPIEDLPGEIPDASYGDASFRDAGSRDARADSGPSTGDEDEPNLPFPVNGDTAVCPAGSTFDDQVGYCVNGAGNALGPFPPGMIAACKTAGGGATCTTNEWPVALVEKVRAPNGTPTVCPPGTTLSPTLGVCADATTAYGPFPKDVVDACKKAGGTKCESQKIDLALLAGLAAITYVALNLGKDGKELPPAEPPSGGTCAGKAPATTTSGPLPASCGQGAKVYNYASNQANYDAAMRSSVAATPWTGARCATFGSVVMQSSVDSSFPLRRSTDGYHPANNGVYSEGFKEALKKRGWHPVAADKCQKGDFAFTQENPETANPKISTVADAERTDAHSAHVFLFNGPDRAIDNQGLNSDRSSRTDTAYCYRAPDATQGCADSPTATCDGKTDGFYCDPTLTVGGFRCAGGLRKEGYQCPTGKKCQSDCKGQATVTNASLLCK